MNIFKAVPFFAFLWIAYNGVMMFGSLPAILGKHLFTVHLISGANWSMSVSDLFIMLGVLFLYIEMFKATRTGTASVIDHSLSALVFIAFLVEFITVKAAGTSAFVVLTLMSLLDVIAGFTITIVSARRDFSMGEHQ